MASAEKVDFTKASDKILATNAFNFISYVKRVVGLFKYV